MAARGAVTQRRFEPAVSRRSHRHTSAVCVTKRNRAVACSLSSYHLTRRHMASLASVPSQLSSARARDYRTRISTRARAPVPTFRRGRSGAVTRAASVSVHDARSLLFGDAAADHVYLDVRTSKEFGEQHAVGAVNVPVADMTPNGPQPVPGFVNAVNARFPGKTRSLSSGVCRARARRRRSSCSARTAGRSRACWTSRAGSGNTTRSSPPTANRGRSPGCGRTRGPSPGRTADRTTERAGRGVC